MSQQAILKKEEEVKIISAKMVEAQSNIIFEYRGLTVAEITELRNLLRAEKVEMKVLKNNISRRSATIAKFEELTELFAGPTAVAFSVEDAIAAARIINDFGVKHPAAVIKGGTIEGSVVPVDEIIQIAKLPSREGLLSMLLSVMQAPIRNLAVVTSQVADGMPNEAVPVAEEKVTVDTVKEEAGSSEKEADEAPASDAVEEDKKAEVASDEKESDDEGTGSTKE